MLTPEIEKRIALEDVLASKWVMKGPVSTPEEIHTEMGLNRIAPVCIPSNK